MQTLVEITSDKTNTVIFPLPIDLLTPLVKALEKKADVA
jgi:hypothetical protein